MEPLAEEDEEEAHTPVHLRHHNSPVNGFTPSQSPTFPRGPRARDRSSVISLQSSAAYSLSGPDGRRLSSISLVSNPSSLPASDRPVPPLPSLRSGDCTTSGQEEPLIDEIASALREWQAMVYEHLKNGQYELFEKVYEYIQTLHAGRRQLLSGALSSEEMLTLRTKLVDILLKGNLAQGLEVIVRHPHLGGLADVEILGPNSMSPIRMYSLQVKSAYSQGTLNLGQSSSYTLDLYSLLSAPENKQHNSQPNLAKLSKTKPSFEHVYLDVRAFVANPCDPGELSELYFSLFSQTESKFLTGASNLPRLE